MKELLKRLEEAEQRANEADAAWGQDPQNEELEKAFDEAYKAQWEAFNDLAKEIQKQTGIDEQTARLMTTTKYRAELKAIIEKAA